MLSHLEPYKKIVSAEMVLLLEWSLAIQLQHATSHQGAVEDVGFTVGIDVA